MPTPFRAVTLTLAASAMTLAPASGLAQAVKAPPATAVPSSPAIAAVQAHLKALGTMTADFAQTDQRGQKLTGQLTLKRPGKIRFAYQKGVPMLIVGDGKSLTVIDYEVKQVQRWPIANSPLSALLDPDRDVARYARAVPTNSPDVISAEVRDPKRPEYGVITMVFVREASAPAGLRLRGWVALDAKGNRTRIDLSNVRYNVPVADTAFRWTDPRPTARGR